LTDSQGLRAFISGCEGLALTTDEKQFYRSARPLGLILFKRNCESVVQIRRIVDEYREAVGSERPLVLIDQEGGRVQRLGPPVWPAYPPARAFNALYTRDPVKGLMAARFGARLIARDLLACGINTNCAPVIDLPVSGAHDIIGNRAYGTTAEEVIALGRAVMEGYLEGGVLPVIKHIPGHGRACADSHVSLPVITASRADLEATDFVPFRALRDAPLGMTAHVLMPELDSAAPASASPSIVGDVIRSLIGFDGLLMCDDIGMNALNGTMEERACAVLAAGCDVVLHCSGDLRQMEAVAAVTPELAGAPLRRFNAATARLALPQPFDIGAAEAILGEVLGESA
jgi:beta-N-acetylhexosaminidase